MTNMSNNTLKKSLKQQMVDYLKTQNCIDAPQMWAAAKYWAQEKKYCMGGSYFSNGTYISVKLLIQEKLLRFKIELREVQCNK